MSDYAGGRAFTQRKRGFAVLGVLIHNWYDEPTTSEIGCPTDRKAAAS